MKRQLLVLFLVPLFLCGFVLNPSSKLADDNFDAVFEEIISSNQSKYTTSAFKETTKRNPNIPERILLLLNRKERNVRYKKLKRKIKNYKSDECDLIIYKDGEEAEVKIFEITQTEIKYKKCDFLDGPTMTISKSDVFMIKYSNGSKEVISEKANPVETEGNIRTPDPYSNTSTAGPFIVGLLAGFLLSLLGMLLALVFQNRAKRKAFWSGWLTGFGLLILLLLLA